MNVCSALRISYHPLDKMILYMIHKRLNSLNKIPPPKKKNHKMISNFIAMGYGLSLSYKYCRNVMDSPDASFSEPIF